MTAATILAVDPKPAPVGTGTILVLAGALLLVFALVGLPTIVACGRRLPAGSIAAVAFLNLSGIGWPIAMLVALAARSEPAYEPEYPTTVNNLYLLAAAPPAPPQLIDAWSSDPTWRTPDAATYPTAG